MRVCECAPCPYPVIIEAFVFGGIFAVPSSRSLETECRQITFDQFHSMMIRLAQIALHDGFKIPFHRASSSTSSPTVRSTLKHIDFCHSHKLKMA